MPVAKPLLRHHKRHPVVKHLLVMQKVKLVRNLHPKPVKQAMRIHPMRIHPMRIIMQEIEELIIRVIMPTMVIVTTLRINHQTNHQTATVTATTTVIIRINRQINRRTIINHHNQKRHQNPNHLEFKSPNQRLIHRKFDWILMIAVTMFINMLRINHD